MIRNLVFDMGNVLVNYEADRVCRYYIKEEEKISRISTSVFVSPEWMLLDLGVISEEEALKRMQARLPSEEEKALAEKCFWDWHIYNMWKAEGMEELIKRLNELGFGIYLCSNASVRLLTCYKTVIPGIEYFDGILFSGAEKCMKPQREIYERLFSRFSLVPEECFFIDDQQLNVQGAMDCGMRGYVYDGSREKLVQVLEDVLGKPIGVSI